MERDQAKGPSPDPRPPPLQRTLRRVPGSFDDNEISPTKETFDEAIGSYTPPSDPDPQSAALHPENIPQLPPPTIETTFAEDPSMEDSRQADAMTEQAVRRHLQDIESSFAAPLSPIPTIHPDGVDDTYLFDSPTKVRRAPSDSSSKSRPSRSPSPKPPSASGSGEESKLSPVREEFETSHDTGNVTSSLEGFSSPAAAAAARTISRTLSSTSAGNGSGKGQDEGRSPTEQNDGLLSPSNGSLLRPEHALGEAGNLRHQSSDASLEKLAFDAGSTPGHALAAGKRPKYLRSRNASQRSSVSSLNANDDVDSDVTVGLGMDYALQSGGALPAGGMSRSTSSILSRSISIGSMASGIDDYQDTSGRSLEQHLATLGEDESNGSNPHRRGGQDLEDLMQTPKPKGSLAAPTDTVIARHVMNVQVPESLANEYKTKGGLATPRKPSDFSISSTSNRHGKNLTLKEQSSTIERLSKENFDLKLKVMFLSDRLDKLSEDGVKEMISENVELKTGLAVLQRDNKVLRKRVKELERQLRDENEQQRPSTAVSAASSTDQTLPFDPEAQEREEELTYLREQAEEFMTEIERLRHENMTKEAEKRRMAEVIKSVQTMNERTTGESMGRQEEADVWKDLLEQETARREQADEDNRKLRDEVFRLKQEMATGSVPGAAGGFQHTTNIYNITKKQRNTSPSRPVSGMSGEAETVNGAMSTASSTLVEELRRESEQLRHENAELRREVGAQTSMLTSRNREKERLYQEIEDLKMAQRRGGPAPSTIDSLLDRSASRAGARERSQSRASGGTRAATTIDDSEREELESKMGELRDKLNEAKLQNQDLQRELNSCMEDFETAIEGKKQAEETAAVLQEDLEAAMNDLMTLQTERDEALQDYAALENEFEVLRREAQEEIDALEGEADQRNNEIERLHVEVNDRAENFDALQEEMRKMSEALVRLEDEQENKLRRIHQLEQELGDANRELEELEAKLLEANDKAQRLSVQQESSQGEIAFLREEQEGDKIRIGDLEAAVANAEQVIREEKDRTKELEQRLATERRQREVVANLEKEEVQQVVNQLNREMSAAKDEARKLRKSLTSREVEAAEWKERLLELENNLREALGDLNGTRSSFLKSIAQLQRELENTGRELDSTRAALMEKDRIIKQRDGLLESHGLESRKVAELLEKERQAHRNTKNQFETFQKTNSHVTRNISAAESRILELETAKAQDKKRIAQLEASFREQLNERNSLLLVLWTRLSSLCGTDWAHDNSLINGRALPSLEAVATMLPGFSKNLLAAVKTIESIVASFQGRITGVEKDLWREYQNLEHNLDARVKKLDRLESIVRSGVAAGTMGGGPAMQEAQTRIARLEDAYRQLKVENATLRTANEVRARAAYASAGGDAAGPETMTISGGSPSPSIPTGPRSGSRDKSRLPRTKSVASGLPRPGMTRSASYRELTAGELALGGGSDPGDDIENGGAQLGGTDGNTKWMHRLRDLELKLKAEREGRLQDRSDASKRILELEDVQMQQRARQVKEERRRRLLEGSGTGAVDGP